jgi:hypothetical protein
VTVITRQFPVKSLLNEKPRVAAGLWLNGVSRLLVS